MSNTTSGLPFPSGGKVLVINMTVPRKSQLRFGTRVHWVSSWEVHGKPLPDGVIGVVIPYAMKPEVESLIRAWAHNQGLKRERVYVEYTSVLLEKNLNGYFSMNGDGDEKVSSTSPAIVEKPLFPQVVTRTKPAPSLSPSTVVIPVAKEPISQLPKTAQVVDDAPTGEFWVKTRRVRPLKGQPRTYFNSKKLSELITSIKSIGQITAIIVRRLYDDPDFDYELIEGERRLRACTIGGIEKILATVRTVDGPEDQFTKSLVANFAREGHTPLETARAIQKMMGFSKYSGLGKMAALREIAKLTGKTDIWAFNYLKLLNLPKEVQDMLEPDDNEHSALPQAMGVFLASIESREIQLKVCKEAVEKGLSVAKAKHLARQMASAAGVRVGSPGRSPVEDYKILRNYLRKANENLEHLVDMPHRAIDELFQNRPLEDRQKALKEIDDLTEKLAMLRNQVDIRTAVRSGD